MKTLEKNINGVPLKFKRTTNGDCLPYADGILQKVLDLLFSYQYLKALRLIAYHEDLTIKNARKRFVDWILWDLGCRITWGTNEKQIHNELDICRLLIEGLTNKEYSNKQIIQMVNLVGFNINYILKP